MTTTTTEPAIDEREALRRKLAGQAAGHEKAQAEIKALGERLKAHDAAEKARQLAAVAERKSIQKQRDAALARHKGASDALDKLRQEFVSPDVRQALSAAKREADGARVALRNTEADLGGARASLEELRHRVATVPSGASAADLKATIKRAEADLAAPEAKAAQARAGLLAAEDRLALAREAYDAAMAAARTL